MNFGVFKLILGVQFSHGFLLVHEYVKNIYTQLGKKKAREIEWEQEKEGTFG